ncbi:N-acetyltransferase [filamentous cyanobacterium CCP1]|nr:N-acetyltransferase [filamentous cyanobacterium CCP2]PSB63339.1 N-acetyltransferase [filamentous cyanobacterium CCP1]
MESDLALTPFSPTDVELLRHWLTAPHVAAWYPDPEDHIVWATNPPKNGDRALITVGSRAVGYIRWQSVSREVLDSVSLYEIPAGSVDVDMLIGDLEFVGQGIGPKALLVLVSQLRQKGDVPLVGLTTSVENLSAQRAYAKAGFRILREYNPPGYGRCYLMVYSLNEDA